METQNKTFEPRKKQCLIFPFGQMNGFGIFHAFMSKNNILNF